MLGVGLNWRQGTQIPDEQPVIIAAGCEVLSIRRPLQPAHLLRMTYELPCALRAHPRIPLEDRVVTATGADDVIVPRDGACVRREGGGSKEGEGGRRGRERRREE